MSKNPMENCEMLEIKGAYRLHFSEEIRREVAIGKGYILPSTEKGVVLCEIPQGQCPYGNEGERVIYTDASSLTEEVCICTSNGLVEKAGKLREVLEETKRDRNRSRAF